MINIKRLFFIFLVVFMVSQNLLSLENPAEMFLQLYETYRTAETKREISSQRSEGSGVTIYDINNKLSNDLFGHIGLYGSSGQTQYLIYKKYGEDIWYFHKKVFFYYGSMGYNTPDMFDTYFKYVDGLPWAFNEATSEYDIQADTNKFISIRDVRSLAELIEIVEKAINN